MRRTSLENPAYYLNRESSWLAFNRRVLEEAEDEQNPLLERVEVLFLIQQLALRHRSRGEILEAYLADDVKARLLRSDGTYVRASQAGCKPVTPSFNAQQFLIEVAVGKRTAEDIKPRSARKQPRPKLLLQA